MRPSVSSASCRIGLVMLTRVKSNGLAISATERTFCASPATASSDMIPPRHHPTSCTGRPVHVIGWSLGGIFSLLTAAADPSLPIASVTALGSPFDIKQVPLVAPLRPLLNLTDGRGAITRTYQALGGAPKPLVRWAFQLSSFQKLVTKPLAVATHLDDTEFLAQIEAVDRFTDNMIAYPGRTFGQLYHRFVKGNALVAGTFDLGDRTIRVADIKAPVLIFGGSTDGIAPIPAVKAVVPLLTGSQEVRFEIVPGGHLGMLTGRRARTTTWVVMDEWISQWSSDAEGEPTPEAARKSRSAARAATSTKATKAAKAPTKSPGKAAKSPAKKAATGRTATKKTAAGKPAAPRGAAKRPSAGGAANPEAIGANPNRRYGSGGSRALSR